MALHEDEERKPLMEEGGPEGKVGAKMECCSSEDVCGDVEKGEAGDHVHAKGGHGEAGHVHGKACCHSGSRGEWKPYQRDMALFYKLLAFNLVCWALALFVIVRAFMLWGVYWGMGTAIAVWFAMAIGSRMVRVQLVKMGIVQPG